MTYNIIFEDFPKISNYFPKISEDSPKFFLKLTHISEHFQDNLPQTYEDNQRLLKTFEGDPTMFQSYIKKFKYRVKNDISCHNYVAG